MRHALPLCCLVLAAAGCTRHPSPVARAVAPAAPAKAAARRIPVFHPHRILRWPRMRADRFGCMLEQRLGHRDPRFNCDLEGYHPGGDPCHDTRRYYEGPAFPASALHAVDPRLEGIELHWEHGDLQAVTLTFHGEIPVADLVRRFGLPTLEHRGEGTVLAEASYPKGDDNISHLSIERCGKGVTCLDLEGFEHQGAGDVDCR